MVTKVCTHLSHIALMVACGKARARHWTSSGKDQAKGRDRALYREAADGSLCECLQCAIKGFVPDAGNREQMAISTTPRPQKLPTQTSCILERESLLRAWRILPMRLIYRPMLSYVIWKAIFRAVKGAFVSWGKLERTASVPVRA